MLICIAALALLFAVLDGAQGSLPLVMFALALFGIGQGLFISPNNSAIVAAAPASLTGEPGDCSMLCDPAASASASQPHPRCSPGGSRCSQVLATTRSMPKHVTCYRQAMT